MGNKDIYDLYKPLRNGFRRFDPSSALIGIWHYSNYINHEIKLPYGWGFGLEVDFSPKKLLIPNWEFEVMAKETILNGSIGGDEFSGYRDMAKMVNLIREIDSNISRRFVRENNVLFSLFGLLHKQLPMQGNGALLSMQRYYEIFGADELEGIVRSSIGVDIFTAAKVAFALCCQLKSTPFIDVEYDYSKLGVSKKDSRNLIERLTIGYEECVRTLNENRSMSIEWTYSPNQLRKTPFVRFERPASIIICPLPELVLPRLSNGIYFDIVEASGFSDRFGKQFEVYVKRVADFFLTDVQCNVLSENLYQFNGSPRHGFDLMIDDGHSCFLVECKTLRVPINVFGEMGNVDFLKRMRKMAGFVVQSYKNLNDIILGRTNWSIECREASIFIVTLEPWYLYLPGVIDFVSDEVEKGLAAEGIGLDLLRACPYKICSVDEFESALFVISNVGFDEYRSRIFDGESGGWDLMGVHGEFYRGILSEMNRSSMFTFLPRLRNELGYCNSTNDKDSVRFVDV